METDRHYFFEGLFIIVFVVAAAAFAIWLTSTGHRDDVTYRIHFKDSVNGLAVGDPVKFRGVEAGTVKTIVIDPENPRLVLVEIRLRKDTPVMTDTRAMLALKGLTGVVYIELNGGDPAAKTLIAATPEGGIPEIPTEKSGLQKVLDDLPKLVDKFSAIEDQVKKAVANADAVTKKVSDDPSVLLWGDKKGKEKEKEKEKEKDISRKR